MKVWLLEYDKFIKVNGLPEIPNAMMFDSGNIPTEDGLFSTTIFGVSTSERKENFAYIELGQKFINPKAYITLKRLNRNFESVIYGNKRIYDINKDDGIWFYSVGEFELETLKKVVGDNIEKTYKTFSG